MKYRVPHKTSLFYAQRVIASFTCWTIQLILKPCASASSSAASQTSCSARLTARVGFRAALAAA